MNLLVKAAIGLILGYLVGILLGVFVAFVLDAESAARFVAIGCALAGAVLGPRLLSRVDLRAD